MDSSYSADPFDCTSMSLLNYSKVGAIQCSVALGIGFVAWLWWHRHAQSKILGPNRLPLLGCTLELVPNWGRLHDWMLEQFSDDRKTIHIAFACPLGDAVYTVDPANVEYFLKTNFSNYPKGKRQCDMMRELFGIGIFTTDGDLWKEQRRVASYEFSSRTLREFSTDVFQEYALKFVLHLGRFASTSQAFDLQDLCMRMTLDTTCRIGFGVELDCLAPSLPSVPFAKCFDDANYISFRRFIDPLWKLKRVLNIGTERKLRECVKVLDDFTYGVINRKRRKVASSTNQMVQSAKGEDLLSRFTDLCNNEETHIGEVYTDKALRDMILNFIVAGRDTTAATLSWFFYMMTCHPEVPDKIVEELCAVTQQPADHDTLAAGPTEETLVAFSKLLTYETLGNLHFLHAALSETLRLFPAVPADGKEAAHDDVLPDGTSVKKGSMIGYLPYSMGRMKSLWGDDALDFKPERWLQDGHFQPQPLFKFTAFQAGPRTCLGKDSAYLQMKITAALALRFFSFHLIPGHPIKYQTMLVLHMMHGLQVTVTAL